MNEVLNNGKREQSIFENHARTKLKLYQDALDYTRPFVTIETNEEKHEFSQGFKVYLVKRLKLKIKDFGSEWNDSRVLQFFDISESILDTIQGRFNTHKNIQLTDCFTSYVLPDFKIYAVTDIEIKRLNTVQKLLEALAELKADRWGVNYLTVAQGVGFCIEATAKDGKPSARYVKQRIR